jgi:hypothetical protein
VPDEAIDLQTDVPHSARVYDFLLGGKDNFPADRAAAEEFVKMAPDLPQAARANRHFMRRVTRHLAEVEGIRQFLDIGTGLPTSPNLHEVVQEVAPESRVVYVDNDPIVLVHARALLTGTPEGLTKYLHADLFEPEAILASDEVRETFDLSRPVALSLFSILHFIEDDQVVANVVSRLMAPLAEGSVLAVSMACPHPDPEKNAEGRAAAQARGLPGKPRTPAELESLLFEDLELLAPGVVPVNEWQPDELADKLGGGIVQACGGVGRKG